MAHFSRDELLNVRDSFLLPFSSLFTDPASFSEIFLEAQQFPSLGNVISTTSLLFFFCLSTTMISCGLSTNILLVSIWKFHRILAWSFLIHFDHGTSILCTDVSIYYSSSPYVPASCTLQLCESLVHLCTVCTLDTFSGVDPALYQSCVQGLFLCTIISSSVLSLSPAFSSYWYVFITGTPVICRWCICAGACPSRMVSLLLPSPNWFLLPEAFNYHVIIWGHLADIFLDLFCFILDSGSETN